MSTMFKFISAIVLLATSLAVQAVTYKIDSTTGKLTGISNLDVLGVLYDVDFMIGRYPGSPWGIGAPPSPEFNAALEKSKASATAAALALYSAILSPSAQPPGVQSDSTLIQGITNPLPYTILAITYFAHSGDIGSVFPDLSSEQPTVGEFSTFITQDISHSTIHDLTSGNAVWAKFTPSNLVFMFSATPDVLWPPNNQLVSVTVSPIQTGLQGCQITSVSSNELLTASDYLITGDLTVDLRAKQSGKNGDRVYTIDISCRLSDDTPVTGNVTVTVPHDHRAKHNGHQDNHNGHYDNHHNDHENSYYDKRK